MLEQMTRYVQNETRVMFLQAFTPVCQKMFENDDDNDDDTYCIST